MKQLMYITLFLVGLFAKAQQDELINNTWYLQKVIIDNVEYFQPLNTESTSTITASFANNILYTHAMCNWIESNTFNNIDNMSFSTDGFTMTLAECSLQVNTDFENNYFGVFFNVSNIDVIHSPFSYTIEDENTYRLLTVINSENNQAVYTSVNLSVEDIEEVEDKVKLYPNPVKDKLYIEIEEISSNYKVHITNLNGQNLLRHDLIDKITEIDISSLEKEPYILTILDENDKVIKIKKILKE